MAHILQKGQTFETGSGTGDGEENTIQSFNGGIGGTKGNMYVDIIVENLTISTDPAQVRVSGDNTFIVNITGASGSSKYEEGDEVRLYVDGDADSLHNGVITSVAHDSGNVALTVRLTDPHTDEHTTTSADILPAAVTSSTVYVTILAPTFVPAFPVSAFPLYSGAGQFVSATVNGVELGALNGIRSYEYQYHSGSPRFVLVFNTSGLATAGMNTLRTELNTDPNIVMTYLATEETFNRLDSEHHIHVGSKTNTTVATVTPITLPDGLTIRAGQGVGDIFLTKVAGA